MTKYGQPVISRETRLLLITIVVSVGSAVAARASAFSGPPCWFRTRRARARTIAPSIELRRSGALAVRPSAGRGCRPSRPPNVAAAALRIGEDVGIGLAVSGLELVRVPEADVPAVTAWTPRIFDYPRYLVAADLVEGNLSLRPVFVGSLVPVESRVWQGPIWRLPPGRESLARHVCLHDRRNACGRGGGACGRPLARARAPRARSAESPRQKTPRTLRVSSG